MKAELMALALLFALVGFINSRLGPGVDDRAAESVAYLADVIHQPWIDTLWQPTPAIQALLLGTAGGHWLRNGGLFPQPPQKELGS